MGGIVMKKRVWILDLLLVVVLTACGRGEKESHQQDSQLLAPIRFVLDWTPNTNHTGVYVADVLGYYEEVGLDVEIVQPPEGGAELMVGSGQAQFGVSFQDYMAPALYGEHKMPITAVAAIIQHNTSGIVSRKGSGIDRPIGMENHRYATWNLPIEQAMIRDVVQADSGDFSKITMIPTTVTDEITALRSDLCDAIWVYYAWAGIKAEIDGYPIDFFAFKDINPALDYYTPVLISNNEYLETHTDQARLFLQATKRGYEYAISHPEEAAEILCHADPALDRNLVIASQLYLKERYVDDAKQWGFIDASRWDNFYDWLYEHKLIDEKLTPQMGFTNEYLPK